MHIFLLILSALLFMPTANAEKYGVLHSSSLALIAADWAMTHDIDKNDGLYETNYLLGKNPSRSEINAYFIGAIIGFELLVWNLSDKNAKTVMVMTCFMQSGYVANNFKLGLRVSL